MLVTRLFSPTSVSRSTVFLSFLSKRSLATRRPLASHLASCSNSNTASSPSRSVSVATMSTAAALPQQPQHFPQPEDAPTSTSPHLSDSETPASSRDSSRSGSKSRKQEEQRGQQRMSTYFPLGYKEAAYQWVSSCLSHRPSASLRSRPTTSPSMPNADYYRRELVDKPLACRI